MYSVEPLFIRLCKYLGIPHTTSYTLRVYEEHPYKNSMYGLSQLLKLYGVANEGVEYHDKNLLSEIQAPFVAHVGNNLVIVKEIKEGHVVYDWQGTDLTSSFADFMAGWSGKALLLHHTSESSEPGYKEHRKKEQQKGFQWAGMVLTALSLLLYWMNACARWHEWPLPCTIITSLSGFYLSSLLLAQQAGVTGKTAMAICGLWQKAHCGIVQNSNASRLPGGISWSEVGFAFFLTNMMAILIRPMALYVVSAFSILSLFFSAWSVWYQYRVVKTWCTLCLMVQALLVMQAAIGFAVLGAEGLPLVLSMAFLEKMTVMAVSYLLLLFVIHSLMPFISDALHARKWAYELKSIKNDYTLFLAQQQYQKGGQVSPSPSTILFGNPHSPVRLTLLTNPFCPSCSEMHRQLQSLHDADVCLQVNLSSFGQAYDKMCLQMIAVYQQKGADVAWDVYSRWYARGKIEEEAFWNQYDIDITNPCVETEYRAHKKWVSDNGLNATPLLYVNNKTVSGRYSTEELCDMLNVEYPKAI